MAAPYTPQFVPNTNATAAPTDDRAPVPSFHKPAAD
jgi:hypothetical protein